MNEPMMLNLSIAIAKSPDVRAAFAVGKTKATACESRFCVNRMEPVFVGAGGMALCWICRQLWHRIMVRKALEIRRAGIVRAA